MLFMVNYYILCLIEFHFNILTTFCGFTEHMFDHNFPVLCAVFIHLFL